MVMLVTLIDAVGGKALNAPSLYALDMRAALLRGQIWRPLTAASYLGPISMHWATNIYFMIMYGANMENDNG